MILNRVPNGQLKIVSTFERSGAEQQLCNFVPPVVLQSFLPNGFTLPIGMVRVGGIRYFRGAHFSTRFCILASSLGMALQEATGRLPEGTWPAHGVMHFLFQHASRIRERLALTRLTSVGSLQPRGPAGRACGFSDFLPDDFGAGSGSGEKWTPAWLVREGREAAKASGIANPTVADCLDHGIRHEAMIWSDRESRPSPDEIRRSLRLALFDLGPADAPDEAVKKRTCERLREAILHHEDDNADQFGRWFFDNFDNIVHQISKQKKAEGGRIPREQVRRAILELVWDSMDYVVRPMNLALRFVARSVTPALNRRESRAFRILNHPVADLGHLPVVLLLDQFPPIRPLLVDVLQQASDRGCWRQLHRALETYSTIARKRREYERNRKQVNESPLPLTESTGAITGDDDRQQALRRTAFQWLDRQKFQCACRTNDQWRFACTDSRGGAKHIVASCEKCQASDIIPLTDDDWLQFHDL